jgi:hypothetical protein
MRGKKTGKPYVRIVYTQPLCNYFYISVFTYEAEGEIFQISVMNDHISSQYINSGTAKEVIINKQDTKEFYKSILGDLSFTKIPEAIKKATK